MPLHEYRLQDLPANGKADLAGREDVLALVEAFYTRAFADPLIGPVFTEVAHMDLAEHLPIMVDFWQTVLFKAGLYKRNALNVHFAIHQQAPLDADRFNRWLALWTETVDGLFAGATAELAKKQAHVIAGSMYRRVSGQRPGSFATITARRAD